MSQPPSAKEAVRNILTSQLPKEATMACTIGSFLNTSYSVAGAVKELIMRGEGRELIAKVKEINAHFNFRGERPPFAGGSDSQQKAVERLQKDSGFKIQCQRMFVDDCYEVLATHRHPRFHDWDKTAKWVASFFWDTPGVDSEVVPDTWSYLYHELQNYTAHSESEDVFGEASSGCVTYLLESKSLEASRANLGERFAQQFMQKFEQKSAAVQLGTRFTAAWFTSSAAKLADHLVHGSELGADFYARAAHDLSKPEFYEELKAEISNKLDCLVVSNEVFGRRHGDFLAQLNKSQRLLNQECLVDAEGNQILDETTRQPIIINVVTGDMRDYGVEPLEPRGLRSPDL